METDFLTELGLTEYESKCYLALYKFKKLSGRQVALKAGVPPSRVYDVLRSLEKKKLIVLVKHEPITYQTIKPKIAIHAYLESRKQSLESIGENIINTLSAIKTGKETTTETMVQIFSGKEQRFSHVMDLTTSLTREKNILSSFDCYPLKYLKENQRAIKRGCKVRAITTQLNKGNRKIIEALLKSKVDVRFLPQLLGFNLMTYDTKTTIIAIRDKQKPEEITSLRISSPDLTKACTHYFNSIWKKCKEINTADLEPLK